jgi:hypothetical protein
MTQYPPTKLVIPAKPKQRPGITNKRTDKKLVNRVKGYVSTDPSRERAPQPPSARGKVIVGALAHHTSSAEHIAGLEPVKRFNVDRREFRLIQFASPVILTPSIYCKYVDGRQITSASFEI